MRVGVSCERVTLAGGESLRNIVERAKPGRIGEIGPKFKGIFIFTVESRKRCEIAGATRDRCGARPKPKRIESL